MKRILVASLGLSLLANGALLLAWRQSARPARASAAPPAQAAPTAAPVPVQNLWALVRRDDPREFAAQLRIAGVPDRAAHLLVAEALRERYLERQRQLIGSGDPAEFWKSAAAGADGEKQAALRRLAHEHEDLLALLYGPGDDETLARARRLYGPLPADKLARLDRIHADYGDMADDIRARAGGLLPATDREMLAVLEQERRKDVAALLTPAELEIYDLQTSATARTLRARLAGFAPTEQEFHALFALQRAFDERLGAAVPGDEAKARERAAAEDELNARIRAALGEARYEEYRRQQEPGYRVAARIAERFGLPVRRATEVDALARDTQARLLALRDERALTPETVRAALAKIGHDAADRLTTLLGPEGAELYKQTSTGAWLRALERATAAAAPADGGPAPAPNRANAAGETPVGGPAAGAGR